MHLLIWIFWKSLCVQLNRSTKPRITVIVDCSSIPPFPTPHFMSFFFSFFSPLSLFFFFFSLFLFLLLPFSLSFFPLCLLHTLRCQQSVIHANHFHKNPNKKDAQQSWLRLVTLDLTPCFNRNNTRWISCTCTGSLHWSVTEIHWSTRAESRTSSVGRGIQLALSTQ